MEFYVPKCVKVLIFCIYSQIPLHMYNKMEFYATKWHMFAYFLYLILKFPGIYITKWSFMQYAIKCVKLEGCEQTGQVAQRK